MKRCPFCKAEIADDSRFCLYCMSSLEEKQIIKLKKNKRRIFLVIPALLLCLVIGIGALWLTMGEDTPAIEEPSDSLEESDEQPATKEPVYIYEVVKAGDDYNLFYSFPEGSAMIVGVEGRSADGEYHIPDTLDGKTVVGVMEGAFCGDDVKSVTLPATVLTIDAGAFSACPALADIYFMGNYIYTHQQAFAPVEHRNGNLTIHCSYDCGDRYMKYYRDSCADYDAEYEEWQP